MNIAGGIYHIGDTDTFFGFIGGANTWSVSTGGSTRLDVNDAGVRFGGAGARIVTVKDEDDMAANSNVALATQQSIKAYVDNKVTGVLTYQGTWNADTNSPTLSSGSGTPGYYYIVSVAGSTNLDGITDWAVGDWAVFSDQATDAWQKIDNTAVGNVSGSGANNRLTLWSGTSTVDSDSNFYMSGTTLYAPNLSNTSGDLSISSVAATTIDSTGDVTIDAGGGDIILSDDGVVTGTFSINNEHLDIRSRISNRDINFKGSDAGSEITALTLDMSAAGAATFNAGGNFSGNVTAPAFYVSGSAGSNYLDVISNDLYIVANQKNILYSGNAETLRLETTGQVEFDKYGSQTFTGTSASYLIATSAGDIIEKTPAQVLSDIGAASSGSLGSYLPLAGGTMTGDITINDDVGVLFGSGGDSFIKHTGANMSIYNDTGHMYMVNRALSLIHI